MQGFLYGRPRRRSTILTTHKIFLNNAVYRLGLLSLMLSIYYGINVWYYNTYKLHDDTNCGERHELVWCNLLESKLFIASTTSILVGSLIVLVFVISMYKTYSFEQSFHTEWNYMNQFTVIIIPFLLISSCFILIIYSSLYINSYISSHHLTEQHSKQFIIHQNVKILNEIAVVFILALDLLNLHHFFKNQHPENIQKCYLSMIKSMDHQSSRISLMSAILFVISLGFVMFIRMNLHRTDKYNDFKVVGFLINGALSMLICIKYAFQRLNASNQIIQIETAGGNAGNTINTRLISNNNYNNNNNNNDDTDNYKTRLIFGIIFAICLISGIIFIWIGEIYDVIHLRKGIDIATFISPEVLYSLQTIFVCLDMIMIKK